MCRHAGDEDALVSKSECLMLPLSVSKSERLMLHASTELDLLKPLL